MNNSESYVSYELAVKLKKYGFDWECETHYRDGYDGMWFSCKINQNALDASCSAPTIGHAAKWLREKHGYHIQINSVIGHRWSYDLVDTHPKLDISDEYISRCPEREGYPVFDTYEAALSAGIDAALKLFEKEEI